MRAYNRCTARLVPRSRLLERCGERGDYVDRGGRLLLVLSRRRDLQKPNSIGVLSAFLGRGADRSWGFGANRSRRLGGDGQAFPITERNRVQIKFNGDRTAFLIIIWQSSISRLRQNNCSLNSFTHYLALRLYSRNSHQRERSSIPQKSISYGQAGDLDSS